MTTADGLSKASQKLEEYISSHNDVLNQRDKRNLKKKLKKKLKKVKKTNPDLFKDNEGDEESSGNEGKDKENAKTSPATIGQKVEKQAEKAVPVQNLKPEIYDDPFE